MAVTFEERAAAIATRMADIQARFKDLVHEIIEVSDEAENMVVSECKGAPALLAEMAPMVGQIRLYMAPLRAMGEKR